MAKAKKEEQPVRVTHIMADGRRLTDEELNGYTIPLNEDTKMAYRIIANVNMRLAREAQKGGAG